MVKSKYTKLGKSGKYCSRQLEFPKKFVKTSFRTIKRGGMRITIGCPKKPVAVKGKSNWMARLQRCRIGTKAQRILKEKCGDGSCPTVIL